MNKSVIKKFEYLSFAILGMLSFLITCASPTLVKASEFEDPDSSAFRYMGMLIAKGGIPYRDAFDNKGPLMYFIQYIGYILSKDYGVYIMEFIFVLSFLIVSYTISKRFMNSRLSLFSVILSSAPLGLFFMGNMTEEYSMFFLSLGLLIFIDYFLFGKQSSVRIIICGFCFGAVLFIRANMAALWPVLCLAVIIKYVFEKHKYPVKLTLSFLIGTFLSTFPFAFWLYSNDALTDFWKDYIVSNVTYAGNAASFKGILYCSIHLAIVSFMEIYIIFLIYLILKKKNVFFNSVYIVFMILNLCMACMSGVVYDHYGMILVPSLVYPSAVLVDFLFSKGVFKNRKVLGVFTIFACSSILFVFIGRNISALTKAVKNGNYPGAEREEVINVVVDNTDPDDRILVMGYEPHYYLDTDRLCSSRFYYSIFSDNYPDGKEAVISDMNGNLPDVVICLNASEHSSMFENYDKYEKIYSRGVWVLKK